MTKMERLYSFCHHEESVVAQAETDDVVICSDENLAQI